MNSLLQQKAAMTSRPRGVTFIAALFLLSTLASLTVATLTIFDLVPLALGAPLLGGGLETLGPLIFLIYAAVCFAAAVGLLRLRIWSRWLATAILVFGIVQIVPSISMAVADARFAATLREGLQIIVRTAALWYLFQEPVRDTFS